MKRINTFTNHITYNGIVQYTAHMARRTDTTQHRISTSQPQLQGRGVQDLHGCI